MNSLVFSICIFIFGVLISSLSQIILKKSSQIEYPNKIREYINIRVIVAYSIFFLATFLTIFAYKKVPLSLGPILQSTGYIFVSFFSWLFLKERISLRKMIGIATIVIGVIIFQYN